MKKLQFIFLGLILSAFSQASTDTIRPKSRVSKVTVFFNGAQVTRTIDFKLNKGGHLLMIEALPEEINAQSIQISALANCKLLSVKHVREPSNPNAPANEKDINAKIKTQELKIKSIKNKQNVYEIEERILLDNSLLSKKDEGSSIARIKEAGDFYRLRLNEIKQAKLDLSVELDAAEEEIKNLYTQMNQRVSKKRLPSSYILINMECERDAEVSMDLSYYIGSAGWEPTYDFRMEDINKPFTVIYNANVFQSSGEHWENANIRLSTVDPSLTADKPQLEPWILGNPVKRNNQGARRESGSIEGTLADAFTLQSIANANVILQLGDKNIASAITDANGKFSFKPVTAGNYLLIISYVGFQSISVGITVNARQVTNQSFYMQANTIAMREQPVPTFQQPKYLPQENYYSNIDPDTKSGQSISREDYQNMAAPMQDQEIRLNTKRVKKVKQVETIKTQEDKPFVLEDLSSTLKETLTAIEYNINTPYTIRSDGQDHVIRIKESTIPARFIYHAVPKLETDVFLVAELADWQKLNLLSGKVSLYFEGTFTGQSFINAELPGDTLEISLGRDKDILVKREGNKMMNDKHISGNTVKETLGWDITIKNNKNSPINLVLEDQYPVSQRKSVEVELLESTGARVDKETGKLSWELTIEAGGKKTLSTKFSVKYPKQVAMSTE